jgi:uncharacterized protein (DUF736 family)
MAHIPSEGTGVLFPDPKKKTPTMPDYRGQIMYKGLIVKLAGWKKKSEYGEFISIKVDNWSPEKQAQQYPREVKAPKDDNDVPF